MPVAGGTKKAERDLSWKWSIAFLVTETSILQYKMNGLPPKSEQEVALLEAQECIHAMKREGFQLDGFNLLSVVASPGAGMISHSTNGTSPIKQSSASRSSTIEEPPEEADIFTDAVSTLGSTLMQVTEQIDTFNMFLGELSKEYLGDDGGGESLFLEYYYQDTEQEEQEMLNNPPTPPELVNLNLDQIQTYLEQCGDLAHDLYNKGLDTRTLPDQEGNHKSTSKSTETAEIPTIFHGSDFDLTDSETFVYLLLDKATNDTKDSEQIKEQNSLYQSTQELVPLKEQDSLAIYLDRVELALQEQVRQKAGAFFHETTRFQQLQTLIKNLLQQVSGIRGNVQQICSVYKHTNDISNHKRQNYEQFVDLMDMAMELIRCKASIGGLLSANDHLGAAQQIQYGRKLLNGEVEDEHQLPLQQLKSLSTCGEQFRQYENLVVQSLSEELVDIFFHFSSPRQEKDRVKNVVEALTLCKAMEKTGQIYERRLQQTIRMTVRTTIAEFVESSDSTKSGGSGVTGMTYPDFYECLQLLIEEIMTILKMARRVDEFCKEEVIFDSDESKDNDEEISSSRWTQDAIVAAADLAAQSIAELLRLRKEAHSLIKLDQMKQLWDTCMDFTTTVEDFGNKSKAVGLRSTLAGQAKAFLDRTHESNMSALVAALDSERWTQCEISISRQTELTRLCTGRAIASTSKLRAKQDDSKNENGAMPAEKKPMAEVEGVNYKVVWSCLLLVEMIMVNLSAAAYFQSLSANAVSKVTELLRLFNSRTTQLVLGAGAIQSAARLKSINAKHLSMVTQCLGMMLALLPHIRAVLMAQLPAKQHPLLSDLDKIKKDYVEHNEKVLNKFVTIIGGIVEHGLAPRIASTDFDSRARDLPLDNDESKAKLTCCAFLDGISTNTRKMHQVLKALLPPDHLQDVFSRIFAYVDQKVPTLFITADATTKPSNGAPTFSFPVTDEGKMRLILELEFTTTKLNQLPGVLPWDFTAMAVLERKLDFKVSHKTVNGNTKAEEKKSNEEEPAKDEGSDMNGDS